MYILMVSTFNASPLPMQSLNLMFSQEIQDFETIIGKGIQLPTYFDYSGNQSNEPG